MHFEYYLKICQKVRILLNSDKNNEYFPLRPNINLHVCTVHQQYQGTFLLLQTDVHNYKIIGILQQLKFRLSLRHVSVHARTIIRELFRA